MTRSNHRPHSLDPLQSDFRNLPTPPEEMKPGPAWPDQTKQIAGSTANEGEQRQEEISTDIAEEDTGDTDPSQPLAPNGQQTIQHDSLPLMRNRPGNGQSS